MKSLCIRTRDQREYVVYSIRQPRCHCERFHRSEEL